MKLRQYIQEPCCENPAVVLPAAIDLDPIKRGNRVQPVQWPIVPDRYQLALGSQFDCWLIPNPGFPSL
ncbi:MAG: hypothetical protein ACJ0DG_05850 [bacterium]